MRLFSSVSAITYGPGDKHRLSVPTNEIQVIYQNVFEGLLLVLNLKSNYTFIFINYHKDDYYFFTGNDLFRFY